MGRSRWVSERWIAVGPWSKEKAKVTKSRRGALQIMSCPHLHLQCEWNWARDLDESWRK
jgi:hypothetical protein